MITNRIKRGASGSLPNGAAGEPLFTTDTYELYIGKGDGTNQRFQKYIASGTASQYIRGDGTLETHNIDSLTDVIVSSPSNGQVLQYNGSNWVNATSGFITGSATAAGQVGVYSSVSNIAGYTTFTFDTVTDKLSMTNAYVNNNLTVDGQLVIKSESGASAYTRGLKFPDNSYGGTGDIAGLRLHNAGGENIILELYAGNDSLDTINFAVAAGGSTYNDNVTINGNKIWNAGNLPSPLSSTGSITSGEIAIFSNSTTVYSDTALFWDNSLNRLGVGGNSPNAQVGVTTSSGVNAFGYRTSGINYYELVLVYDNTTYGHTFQANRGSTTSARNITFLNGSNTVSIDENGNMGIGLIVPNPGTSGPGGLGLDIYASTTAALAFHNATSGTGISAGGRIYYNSTNMTIRNLSTGNMTMTVDNGNFTVITLGAENIKVEGSTGKVGIGSPPSITEILTVNGSIQQSGVTNALLKANASGKIIAAVAGTDYIVGNFDATATVRARTAKTTYRDNSSNPPTDAPVRSLTNSEDNWIYLDTASTEWGIYHRNIDSTLSVAGQPDLPPNSIAFIGANNLQGYISLQTGRFFAKEFVRNGGTSSQFLKADGSVDGTSYQPLLSSPVTGSSSVTGRLARWTGTTTIGESLIFDSANRAIAIANTSVKAWGSPFYVIEGGTHGQFLGYQTNGPIIKLGVNTFYNGANYIYTNSNFGVGILDVTADATNAGLRFYSAPAGTAGNVASITSPFGVDVTNNISYFNTFLGVGRAITPTTTIEAFNSDNASTVIQARRMGYGITGQAVISLAGENLSGVALSRAQIRAVFSNVNTSMDTNMDFHTTAGTTDISSATLRMRINPTGNVSIGSTNNTYQLDVTLPSGSNGQIIRMNRSAGAYGWGLGIDSNSVFGIYDNGGNVRLGITSGGQLLLGNSTNGGYNISVYSGVSAAVATANGLAFRTSVTGTLGQTDLAGILWNDYSGNDLARILPVVDNTNASAATHIRFYTHNGTSFGERMRLTSGGNVGIGTTSPEGLLHISGASSGGYVGMAIVNRDAASNTTAGIDFGTDSSSVYNGQGNGQISVINTGGPGTSNKSEMNFKIWNGSAFVTGLKISDAGRVSFPTATAQNWALSNASAITVNPSNTATIASCTITATGKPILINATGDINPIGGASWCYLYIHRNGSAIGKYIIAESTASSANNPFALTTIDTPSAGSVTYTIVCVMGGGNPIIFGETGNGQAPTILAVELL